MRMGGRRERRADVKTKPKNGRHRVLWGLAYVSAFVAAFVGGALLKVAWSPLSGRYEVEWTEQVGRTYTDIAYGEGAAEKFDLYIPTAEPAGGTSTYGLIVYLHPGGFTAGDKSGDAQICQYLAAKGYVAASVNYTLADGENGASVNTMSQDIKRAMPRVVAAAAARGCTVDRMAVGGGSAGGCLALIYAYRDAGDAPVPVRFVFEMVGPASFTPEGWDTYGLDQSDEAAAAMFTALSGNIITPEMIGTPEFAEAVRDISPDLWVNEESVPTLAAYGVHDKVCPYACSRPLVAALEEHGVPHDVIDFPHSGHGLQNDDTLYVRYMELLDEYLERYLSA